MLEIYRNLQISWSSPASKVLLLGHAEQTRQQGAATSLSYSTVPLVCEVQQATSSLSLCRAKGVCRGAYTDRASVGMSPKRASAIQGGEIMAVPLGAVGRRSTLAVRVLCPQARSSPQKQLLSPLSGHLPSTLPSIHVNQSRQGPGSHSPLACSSLWLCRTTQPRLTGAAREWVPQQLCMASSPAPRAWEGWLHCHLRLGHHCLVKNLVLYRLVKAWR